MNFTMRRGSGTTKLAKLENSFAKLIKNFFVSLSLVISANTVKLFARHYSMVGREKNIFAEL